jgi:hypothetical protein
MGHPRASVVTNKDIITKTAKKALHSVRCLTMSAGSHPLLAVAAAASTASRAPQSQPPTPLLAPSAQPQLALRASAAKEQEQVLEARLRDVQPLILSNRVESGIALVLRLDAPSLHLSGFVAEHDGAMRGPML